MNYNYLSYRFNFINHISCISRAFGLRRTFHRDCSSQKYVGTVFCIFRI